MRKLMFGLSLVAISSIMLFDISETTLGLLVGRALIGTGHEASIIGIKLFVVGWVRPEHVASVAAPIIAMASGLGGLKKKHTLPCRWNVPGSKAPFSLAATMGGVIPLV